MPSIMPRAPLVPVVLGLAALLPAQAQPISPHVAWLQQRYPDFHRANLYDAVQAARQQGLLRSDAEQLAFKRAFAALRQQKRAATAVLPVLLDAPLAPSLQPVGDAVVTEVEFNDGIDYATPLGLGTVARGDCSLANDVDVFRFLSIGEYVTAEVLATGSFPIVDSTLEIRTESGQLIAFSEDISATNLLSRASAWLPAGYYALHVVPWNSSSGGTYDVAIQRDPVNTATLQPGANSGTTTLPGTGTQTVWSFTLASDATVDLAVTGSGLGVDLTMAIQQADGRLLFTNDDSGRFSLDPSADLDLPAGTYTVHVADLGGNASPYGINFTVTPTVLPELSSSGPQTGNILGSESRRLYRFANPVAGKVDFVTTAGSSQPIGDTIVYLFDADLNYLCDIDDANQANPNDYYSQMSIGLPAGVYYVAVRGYTNVIGDYVLTTTWGNPFPATTAIAYGRSAVPAPGSGIIGMSTLDVCTDSSARIDSNGGATATLYNFMDQSGHSLGTYEWSEDAARIGPGGRMRSRETTGFLPRGTHYVLSWYRFEQTYTSMTLDVLPTLNCEGGQLVSHGKAGDFSILFGAFGASTGVNLAPLGIDGWFCLPLASSPVLIGLHQYNTAGTATWLPCPTTTIGVYLQHGDIFAVPGTFLGACRERRRL